ncbi:SDR family oxidoreductase [Cryobacterium sp. PH29-G1]|uniref:SDR family NAD(P)-dependent oxidoreductase n=1 Tax=Cryobacterium sp. PH29-G1 TaxID=3046211 RepID=UPI0024B9D27F|nr:SDR family oxidoreductase [Cryobacterium sp. PH29-G1]MDJ0349611.1 SDR family oxidoreductase [Cryobacterium sp. PH29-G1]
MNDQVAIVTGSSSGIGKAIATRLSREGWRVVLNGYHSQTEGQLLSAELSGSVYIDADVSTADGANSLVSKTIDEFGRLDVLINNAGIARQIPHSDLDAVDDEFWDQVMAVNLKGPWNMSKAARPHLVATRGQIINTASLAGLKAAGSSIPYAISKAGVIHLTQLLAKALGPDIRVNAVAPGYIDTPLTRDWHPLREFMEENTPARRLGVPEDVAEVVHGLLSMRYVTGTTIPIDGGAHLL